MQALKFRDGASELLARFRPRHGEIERARGNPHGHGAGADALAVVRIHQIGEAALESRRRCQHHRGGNREILEDDLALGHAAEPHGRFASDDA